MFDINKSACVLAAAFFVSLASWGNAFAQEGNGFVGAEGCTPGFWKQEHHFDDWVVYTPGQSFFDVFFEVNGVEANVVNGLTLSEALRVRGGGIHAVYRHGVAALLNAAHPYIGYPFWGFGDEMLVSNTNGGYITPEQVIYSVQMAYNCHDIGDKYCVEEVKYELERANESGHCPLPMEMHTPW